MRNSNSTHINTAATPVETKSYDTAILVISGLFLIMFAFASCALAVIYGIEREPFDPVIFM
jgi:hypothetical protein